MMIENLIMSALINDQSEIYVRDPEMHVLAYGNWYHDNVLEYMSCKIDSFTWQDDNKIYIDIK